MKSKMLAITALAAGLALPAGAAEMEGQGAGVGHGDEGVRTIIGRVVDVRDFELENSPDAHRLVLVERNGKRILVDLGARAADSGMNLQKGDILYARGKVGRISGKPMVFARYAAEIYPAGHRKAG